MTSTRTTRPSTRRRCGQPASVLQFFATRALRQPGIQSQRVCRIDDYVDAEVQAVKMHCDQLARPCMPPERVRGIASFRGGRVRRRVAEAYEPGRLLSTEMEKL